MERCLVCAGPAVPPAEPFQDPLPEPSATGGDLSAVAEAVRGVVADASARALVGNLGFQCASTFRTPSWFGGCNGGRIRFEPQVPAPSFRSHTVQQKMLDRLNMSVGDIGTGPMFAAAQ